MKFIIEDFELDNKKTEVEAPGLAEAMFEYLPWPTLDLQMLIKPTYGNATVIDRMTGFKYSIMTI